MRHVPMMRQLTFFVVFAVACCFADENSSVQLQIEIPERNISGSPRPAWPDGVKTQIMASVARAAPEIARFVFGSDAAKGMSFQFAPSSKRGTAFDVLVVMPVIRRANFEQKLGQLEVQLSIQYVTEAFIYDAHPGLKYLIELPAKYQKAAERVAAVLISEKEDPSQFKAEVEENGKETFVFHLWHISAFKAENAGAVGNPGGKCRDIVYDVKSGRASASMFWQ
jgi:hypothetical protein